MNRFYLIMIVILSVSFFSRFGKDPPRQKTFWETHHLYCATGVSSENEGVFRNADFALVNIFIAWQDSFPWAFCRDICDSSLLMITWEPYIGDFSEPSILPEIIHGTHDRIIAEFADSCISYGGQILLRWGHEMNGSWYPWSGIRLDRERERYITAYRRIYDIFRERGCENVKFVFCVNGVDVPDKRWNRFEGYYPGDSYVDFLGIDVYNWGSTQKWGKWPWSTSRWRSPKDIISNPYERMIHLAPSKPILLCEVGSSSTGGDKRKWLREFFHDLKTDFTAVKGFLWFDYTKETDWGISADACIWETFMELIHEEHFVNSTHGKEIFQ